ncbi:hypothetical protein P846_05339 [Klebsiella pneumoniae UCI 43]|nr:hypothetical protein P846_05339 [Klebsiella pneumoniae UCI 43]
MKVTEPGLNTLIDNLNTLICEDSLLTRQERETLVRAVAAHRRHESTRQHEKRRSADRCQTGKKGEKRPPA